MACKILELFFQAVVKNPRPKAPTDVVGKIIEGSTPKPPKAPASRATTVTPGSSKEKPPTSSTPVQKYRIPPVLETAAKKREASPLPGTSTDTGSDYGAEETLFTTAREMLARERHQFQMERR